MANIETNCRHCGALYYTTDPSDTWCGDCPILDPKGTGKREQKLKLFEANFEPDYHPNRETPGFLLVVLAENLEQAKVFVQAQFNIEYEGVVDVFNDVEFTEIKGPFPAGKVLVSLHY